MGLLDDEALERSGVVANCAMNRGRRLTGGNGYGRELGFAPVEFLLARRRPVAWLDLCCGEGRAQLEAALALREAGCAARLVGVDLVSAFAPPPEPLPELVRVEASLHRWAPAERFDLITCVHGLHYVGDKLGLLARAAGWLAPRGVLVANLDLANLRDERGGPLGRQAVAALRRAGFSYDGRRRLLRLEGRRRARLPFTYLGGDDRAGPNCTGQGAVHSVYRLARAR